MSTPVQSSTLQETKTKKKKRKGRWQAVLLAGLMIAGSVAVPQAADAAWGHKSCPGSRVCIVAMNTTRPVLTIATRGKYEIAHKYTVRTAGGKLLCSGRTATYWEKYPRCNLKGYIGRVRVTVAQGWHPNFSVTIEDDES
ncbi:hypothetical protein [Microbacterium galbinum]|uniref:Uncharacterized protein n=1 Tax=Microbacterium galbinum TaxID=2851646 RepID=A0ABY4IPS3_9MICO|nr:hypothetical protein [Microbacterium galbinum]UPL13896.1 hypothetical protein KV396_05125 [Microbacterium galbinum]